MIRKLHYVWFGPKQPPRYMYYSLLSAYCVYGVKPMLWVNGCDIPNYMLDVCAPVDIPNAYLSDIDRVDIPATKSDYIRYRVLADHLGLYVDSDTLHNRSIEQLVGSHSLVVGDELYDGGRTKFRSNNAIIYVSSSEHVVRLSELAMNIIINYNYSPPFGRTGPDLLTPYLARYFTTNPHDDSVVVLPRRYFYKYSWKEWRLCFRTDYTQADLDDYYIMHFWNTHSKDYVDAIDDSYLSSNDNLYTAIVRGYTVGQV